MGASHGLEEPWRAEHRTFPAQGFRYHVPREPAPRRPPTAEHLPNPVPGRVFVHLHRRDFQISAENLKPFNHAGIFLMDERLAQFVDLLSKCGRGHVRLDARNQLVANQLADPGFCAEGVMEFRRPEDH